MAKQSPPVRPQHTCAIPGCDQIIARTLLMCASHWRLVPRPLQNAVWKTWRNGGADEYLAAREAAVNAVEALQ